MRFKLNLDEKYLYDSSQFHNLVSDMVIPGNIHVFLRRASNHTIGCNVHSQFILWICLKGRGHLLVDDADYIVKENEAMITFPGQPHMRLPLKPYKVDWLLIRFETTPPEWLNVLKNQLLILSEKSIVFLQEFIECYEKAHREKHEMISNECFYRLGLLLNSLRNTADTSKEELNPVFDEPKNDYVKQACQLMISGKFSRKKFYNIARELGISPGHLRALFKSSIGSSPTEVAKRIKLSTAQHLLLHSMLNITQIAERVGFGSVYSFSRFFRKNNGMSPRKYQQMHRKTF